MYNVLIADDETWVIFGLKRMIEKSGLPFRVIGETNDGVTTLEEVEKKKPDVLFSDIRMPGYTGLELLEHIQEKKLDVKVVFVSGYAEFTYAQKALSLGAVDYLLKPIKPDMMTTVLKKLEVKLAGKVQEEVIEQKEEKVPVIEQIITEIQEHYTENITLTELAKKYGISVGYLSSLIKENVGLSYSDYVTARRIQKAKELLEDETLSIEQIAEQTGYNDYYYFTKVFKKTLGISPSKYRKNYKK